MHKNSFAPVVYWQSLVAGKSISNEYDNVKPSSRLPEHSEQAAKTSIYIHIKTTGTHS